MDQVDGVFQLDVTHQIWDQSCLQNPEIDGSPDSASTQIPLCTLGSLSMYVLNTVRRLMGLSTTDYGDVLNKIKPFCAALPFIDQQLAIPHLSVCICPACLMQSHSHLKRPWLGLSCHSPPKSKNRWITQLGQWPFWFGGHVNLLKHKWASPVNKMLLILVSSASRLCSQLKYQVETVLRIRVNTSAPVGDPDPYLSVYILSKLKPRTVWVIRCRWPGSAGQVPVKIQVLVI